MSKDLNIIINNKINWILITHKEYPLFSRVWMNEAFRVDMKEVFGMGFNNYKSLYSGIYADKNELEKLRLLLIAKLEKDTSEIWNMCTKWQQACDEAIVFSKKNNFELPQVSDQEIMVFIEILLKKLRKSAAYLFLHHILGPYFENQVREMLNKRNVSTAQQKSYFQILTTPFKKTDIMKSQIDLVNLSNKVKKYGIKACQKSIEDYATQYRWLGYDTGIGSDLTIEDTKEKINDYTSRGQKNKFSARSTIEKRLQLNVREIDLLNLMGEIIYLGKYREESHSKVGVYLRPVLNELAQRFNLTYEELVQFTLPEIKESIQSGIFDKTLPQKRKYKFGLITLQGKHHVISGNEVNEYEPKKSDQNSKIKTFKGIVVNMGKATGPAKVVLSKSDFEKVEKGDILIAKMTNPDYISVLQKCAAIVTDIGGITSHAAIISREMGKPCITGTKIATQMLSDGDLVEVDAINGEVKKI